MEVAAHVYPQCFRIEGIGHWLLIREIEAAEIVELYVGTLLSLQPRDLPSYLGKQSFVPALILSRPLDAVLRGHLYQVECPHEVASLSRIFYHYANP